MNRILVVKQLTKMYGGKTSAVAVDQVSFDLKEGEILGLLGPNGSGKTTTIQMLLGTLAMTSGTISYFGKEFPRYRSEILQQVSFASTYTNLPFLLTVLENLRCFGGYYGLSRRETEKRVHPLLERFGIADKIGSSVASLSAGQVTRLMLVKAFLTHPKVVLLDEPTASLDPDIAKEVCDFLLEQRTQTGLSILFTSHRMDEVTKLCDRVVVLRRGKMIADDLPQNLARSGAFYRLSLTIVDGMKRVVSIASRYNMVHVIEHRVIRLSLDEKHIPVFLNEMIHAGISYSNIQIAEPSLEDYFLKIAEE